MKQMPNSGIVSCGKRLRTISDVRRNRQAPISPRIILSLIAMASITLPLIGIQPIATAEELNEYAQDAELLLASASTSKTLESWAQSDSDVTNTPNHAVVLDLSWRSTGWAGANQAKVISLEKIEDFTRFTVRDQHRKGSIWIHYFDLPIDYKDYPILVFRYRAKNILTEELTGYTLWLDDTSGPATGGLMPILNTHLTADGKIHELRRDLRKMNPKGEIIGAALHISCDHNKTGVFDLFGINFEADPKSETPLEIEKDWEATVEVLDPSGNPVDGATVTFDAERLNFACKAVTGTSGTVNIQPFVNKNEKHMLRVEKEGMVPAWLNDIVLEEGTILTVTIHPGTHYGGTVENEEGEPIEGVSVTIRNRSASIKGTRIQRTYNLMTDGDGRWQTPLLPLSLSQLSIRLVHYDYTSDAGLDGERVPPIEKLRDKTCVLIMKRGLALSGSVVDEMGNAIPDAIVRYGASHFDSQSTNTDTEGAFFFKHIRYGEITLCVQKKGYSPELKKIWVYEDSEPVEFMLVVSGTIRGKIVTAEGEPIPNVSIALGEWRESRSIAWYSNADSEGKFSWNQAPQDEALFTFYTEEYMTVRDVPMKPREEEYIITMYPPLIITGTVIEAETEDPIKKFTIASGVKSKENGPITWDSRFARTFADGKYEYIYTWPFIEHYLRAEAEGYISQISRGFTSGEGNQEFNFELHKASNIVGKVFSPQGSPLADVVVVCTPLAKTRIINGHLDSTQEHTTTKTDTEGSFSFPLRNESFNLLALHDQGHAVVTDRELFASPEIKLEAWGKVKGELRINSRPGNNEIIVINPDSEKLESIVSHQYKTTTDKYGRFAFERVVSGNARIHRIIKLGLNNYGIARSKAIFVEAGKTTNVRLGGVGQPVVGRIIVPKGIKRKVTFTNCTQDFQPKDTKTFYEEEYPNKDEGEYRFQIKPDGSFRGEDIPTGIYEFTINVYKSLKEDDDLLGKNWIGSVYHEFEIPKIPGGQNDRPYDLGNLILNVFQDLRVGDTAPEFLFTTSDKKTITHKDLRGKSVLFYFWSPTQQESKEEIPFIKELFTPRKDDDRLILIGLSVGEGKDTKQAQAQISKHALTWMHVLQDDWVTDPLRFNYGVRALPKIYLIDSKGYIAAVNLCGGQIRFTVEKHLGIESVLPVKPLEGIGYIKFGMTKEEVIRHLGQPEKIVDNGVMYLYPSKGLTVGISPQSGVGLFDCYTKKAVGIGIPAKDFKGITDKAIEMGSSEEEIIAAYGEPDKRGKKGRQVILKYKELGIDFTLRSDKLIKFRMAPVK